MANQLGISSSTPTLLSYPRVLPFKDVPELKGAFVYVIEAYPLNGLSVVVARFMGDDGVPTVSWKLGDWDGHIINMNKEHPLKNAAKTFMYDYSDKILKAMQIIGLPQAQFYMSNAGGKLMLTDVRISANKLIGPGAIASEQLFSGVIATQKQVVKPMILDEEAQEKIKKRTRPFNVDVILKPSAFKTITRGRELQPMYGLVS